MSECLFSSSNLEGNNNIILRLLILTGQQICEKMLNFSIYKGNTNTMRYHHILVRIVIISKTRNKWWRGQEDNRILIHCWWEHKLMQPLSKTVWGSSKNLELSYDPAIYLKNIENTYFPSMDDWIKMCFIYIYNGILLSY